MRDHTPVLIPSNKPAKDSLAKNAVAEVGEGFLRVGLRGTAEVGVLGGVLETEEVKSWRRQKGEGRREVDSTSGASIPAMRTWIVWSFSSAGDLAS